MSASGCTTSAVSSLASSACSTTGANARTSSPRSAPPPKPSSRQASSWCQPASASARPPRGGRGRRLPARGGREDVHEAGVTLARSPLKILGAYNPTLGHRALDIDASVRCCCRTTSCSSRPMPARGCASWTPMGSWTTRVSLHPPTRRPPSSTPPSMTSRPHPALTACRYFRCRPSVTALLAHTSPVVHVRQPYTRRTPKEL